MQSLPLRLEQTVEKAYIIRPHRSRLPITPLPDGTLPSPDGAQAGVYRLYVETPCGCFSSLVYVPCPPPAFKSKHNRTQPEKIQECCE